MGFLTALISTPEERLESALEAATAPIYESRFGMSPEEARSHFRAELSCIKEIVANRGEFVAPEGHGDFLLRNRCYHPEIDAYLAKIKAEGVRDEDILSFWNMSNFSRIHQMRFFDSYVTEHVLGGMRLGLTPEQAGARARKVFPFFGDPNDTSVASGEDRPLPVELKDRIEKFMGEQQVTRGRGGYIAFTESYPSFNALIRLAIKYGKI